MKNILIFIIGVIFVVGGIFYFVNLQKNENTTNGKLDQQDTDTESAQEFINESSDTVDLKIGGSSYLDPSGVFNFLYPNDYTLDVSDPVHVRIYKRGVEQRPQSEMSDGALIVFEVVDLNGRGLSEFVDGRIDESTKDGTSEIVKSKKSIVVNNYLGYSYVLRGLGEANYIVVQKNPESSSAVVITYSVSDPKNIGYQKEIESIISNFKLLK